MTIPPASTNRRYCVCDVTLIDSYDDRNVALEAAGLSE
jgi:hypothetical protein